MLVVTESLSFFKMCFAQHVVNAVVHVCPPSIVFRVFSTLNASLYCVCVCVCVLLCLGADIAGVLLVALGFFSFFRHFLHLRVIAAVVQVRIFLYFLSVFSNDVVNVAHPLSSLLTRFPSNCSRRFVFIRFNTYTLEIRYSSSK